MAPIRTNDSTKRSGGGPLERERAVTAVDDPALRASDGEGDGLAGPSAAGASTTTDRLAADRRSTDRDR